MKIENVLSSASELKRLRGIVGARVGFSDLWFEDDFQNGVLRVWIKRHRFNPDLGSVMAWCVSVISRVILSARSHRAHHSAMIDRYTSDLWDGWVAGDPEAQHQNKNELAKIERSLTSSEKGHLISYIEGDRQPATRISMVRLRRRIV